MSKMILDNGKANDKKALSLVKSYAGCSDESANGLISELKALWGATEPGGGVLLFSTSKQLIASSDRSKPLY